MFVGLSHGPRHMVVQGMNSHLLWRTWRFDSVHAPHCRAAASRTLWGQPCLRCLRCLCPGRLVGRDSRRAVPWVGATEVGAQPGTDNLHYLKYRCG